MLLRSLQSISQLYIKYTENTLLIHDDNDGIIVIVVIIIVHHNSDLRIKKKFSFK